MAAKIKDGLFIGDADTSQSEIFINDNKISNLINVAGKDVPNIWASHGLVYLTYNWEDRPDFRLFSSHEDSILTDIVEFIDVSIQHGISVLIFSKNGTGRSVVAACLYLMMKYRWGFEKSYDYVYSKKPDIDLNKGFIQQMFALDMKLLASRQKAHALKHGIENSFRIEPNMTINDIAAMLPANEAKRWNSWDPNYILNPMTNENIPDINVANNIEEVVTWQKYSDPVITAIKKKDLLKHKTPASKQKVNVGALDDTEEELVLIFSYVNSKNTISALPGPYHNIYEQHKQFKLRFDHILFEEDINMFPNPPPNSRFTYPQRGILKGSRKKSLLYNANTNTGPPSSPHHNYSNEASSKMFAETSKHRDDKLSSAGHNATRSPTPTSSSGANILASPSNNSVMSSSTNNNSDDLYKFVGVSNVAPGKDNNSNNPGGMMHPRDEKKGSTTPTVPQKTHHQQAWSSGPSDEDSKSPMSAEDRLRRLMADMQRQNHFPEHLRNFENNTMMNNEANNNTGGSSKNNNLSTTNNGSYSTVQRNSDVNNNSNPRPPPARQQAKDVDEHFLSTSSGTLSLYELANMHLHTSAAAQQQQQRGGHLGNDHRGSESREFRTTVDFTLEDLEREESNNNHNSYHQPQHGSSSGSSRLPVPVSGSNVRSSKGDPLAAFDAPSSNAKGAMRARHDILAGSAGGSSAAPSSSRPSSAGSSSTRPGSAPRQAWGNTPSGPAPSSSSTPSRSSSSGNVPARYASPSNARAPSSNSSVGSTGSNASNNNMVGAGTSSSSRVYRHGSPAPNNGRVPTTSSRMGTTPTRPSSSGPRDASSNASVASNASLSTIGSMGQQPQQPTGRYSTTPSSSYNTPLSKTTPSRYASPMAGSSSNNNNNPALSSSSAQRRGSSSSSINSVGSNGSLNPPTASANDPTKRRTTTGVSPMRASYGTPSNTLSVSGNNINPTTRTSLSSSQGLPSTSAPSSGGPGGSSSAGVSSRRFSTPTPQSGQHHDYDNGSTSSNTRPSSRPSTPTRAWKF